MTEPTRAPQGSLLSIACTADDMGFRPQCVGCCERFDNAEDRDQHESWCVAVRDLLIDKKLAAQARDDGDDERAAEIMEEWLL